MKKLIFTCLVVFTALVGHTQNVQPNSKVLQSFDSKALQAMNDSQIEYMNYFVKNGFVVHNEAKTKEGLPLLSSVLKQGKTESSGTGITQESFNPYNYNITVLPNESQFFLIDGTNGVVQIHSQSTIDMQYDRYLVNQKKLNGSKK